ncbi:MAG: hypothetical protein V4850_10075 [Myxococcota bacterium]
MRSSVLFVSLLALAACTGGSDDTGDKDRPGKETEEKEVTLTIAAPADGREFDADEAVPLQVTAKRGSRATDITSASWTIGGWTGQGVSTEATGLPSGAHTVSVDAVVGGETYTATVDITVLEPAITFWTYSGVLEADVTLESDFGDFDDHCTAPITFTIDQGTVSGGGQCMVFSDFVDDPLVFTMEGTVRGGTISGALVISSDDGDARTPFEGTGTAGNPLTASFDETHRSSDGSLRIAGSWTATAQ